MLHVVDIVFCNSDIKTGADKLGVQNFPTACNMECAMTVLSGAPVLF